MPRLTPRLVSAVAALGLATAIGAGCASSPDRPSSAGTDLSQLAEGYLPGSEPDADAEPVDGGTLTWGAFSEPSSLDPKVTIAALTTGGQEMLGIYDSLLRYDAGRQEFVAQLAKDISSADDVTWTLTLRPGVTFSDGTALDAAAVKKSQLRYAEGGPESALWKANVASIRTPDKHTVVYTLERPWAQFPGMLTTGPGMVVAPGSGEGPSFQPVGAGPFVLADWRPDEAITLEANPRYWAGRAHLDAVKVVFPPDEDAAVDAMAGGSLDAIFVREPDHMAEVLEDDPEGYLSFTAAQNGALINAGRGRPGADVRIRQALQLAIDPQVVTERAFDGAQGGSSTVFPEYSRWHGDTEGLPYNPARAKKLVAAAKADGFDGTIVYGDISDPASRSISLALKALWEAVGFDVELDPVRSVSEMMTDVAVDQDYDVVAWGFSFREADPLPKMYGQLHSDSPQTYGGATSPEMDALLTEFQTAGEVDAQRAVMQRIQAQINREVPFVTMGPFAELVTWNDQVHGVVGTANSMVSFASAWKDR